MFSFESVVKINYVVMLNMLPYNLKIDSIVTIPINPEHILWKVNFRLNLLFFKEDASVFNSFLWQQIYPLECLFKARVLI